MVIIMRKFVSFVLVPALFAVAGRPALAQERSVYVLTIESAITPITVKQIQRVVEKSVEDGAEALVIQLNTPGGLGRYVYHLRRPRCGNGFRHQHRRGSPGGGWRGKNGFHHFRKGDQRCGRQRTLGSRQTRTQRRLGRASSTQIGFDSGI